MFRKPTFVLLTLALALASWATDYPVSARCSIYYAGMSTGTGLNKDNIADCKPVAVSLEKGTVSITITATGLAKTYKDRSGFWPPSGETDPKNPSVPLSVLHQSYTVSFPPHYMPPFIAPRTALVGFLGDEKGKLLSGPYVIGTKWTLKSVPANPTGAVKLYLGVHCGSNWQNNEGSFTASVTTVTATHALNLIGTSDGFTSGQLIGDNAHVAGIAHVGKPVILAIAIVNQGNLPEAPLLTLTPLNKPGWQLTARYPSGQNINVSGMTGRGWQTPAIAPGATLTLQLLYTPTVNAAGAVSGKLTALSLADPRATDILILDAEISQ